MIRGLMVIFFFQLLGDAIRFWVEGSIAGPVIGLVLLLGFLLCLKPSALSVVKADVITSSRVLLRYLPLLFVPAGVGVVALQAVVAPQWLEVLLILVVGVILTLALTGWLFQRLLRASEPIEGPS